jgi:putative tryptophan/tyrosine transport system permease protein
MIETLIDGCRLALILSPLALGVFISYRILGFIDLTVDGAFTAGAFVSALVVVHGGDPLTAALFGAGAGLIAGVLTGVIHAGLGIRPLLAGIIVMTGLYSANNALKVHESLAMPTGQTLRDHAVRLLKDLGVATPQIGMRADLVLMLLLAVGVILIVLLLHLSFRTHFGLAAIAAGDNRNAARANGVRVRLMFIVCVAVANGLVALSGALFAMDSFIVEMNMGVGMVVTGLAAVVIGDALTRGRAIGRALPAAIAGIFLLRLIVAMIVFAQLDGDYQRLATAVVLLIVLLPRFRSADHSARSDE